MQAESIAKASQHSKIVNAFKSTFWPEGVTQDGDMAQYVDALAQLFSMRKIREAQARGVNVEEAVNNGNIEVVNDGKTVKVVLRHNARTETAADTQQTTEATPTTDAPDTSAEEVDEYDDIMFDSEGKFIHVTSQADWAASTIKGEKAIGDMLDVEFDEIRTNKGTPVFKFHKVFSIKEANRINKIFIKLFMNGEKLIQIPAKTIGGRDVTFVYAMREQNGERVEDFYGIAEDGLPMQRALKDEAESRDVSEREREQQKLDIDEADVIASFEQDATVGQAPTTPIWRKALNREKKKFGAEVDRILSPGYKGSGEQIPVMRTPLVFGLLGEKLRPVTMFAQKILDIKRNHKNITDDMIKDIPEQLANPVAVLESSPESTAPKGSYVIVTEYNIKGKAPIIAFHTEKKNGVHTINRVASIHDRRGGLRWVQSEIQAGRLRYWDTKRGPAAIYQVGISNTSGHTLPSVVKPANLAANNIATDVDLDKARAQYNFEVYQDARGKTTFTPEETIISVFEGGDKSTMIHELGHVFLWMLETAAGRFADDEALQRDWRTICEYVGRTDDKTVFTREQHEKLAKDFTQYVSDGKAPSARLAFNLFQYPK